MKASNYLFAMLLPFITKMATCGGMTDNFCPKENEEARETSKLLLFIPPNSLQMLHNNDNPPGDMEKNDGRESQRCGSSTRIDVSMHIMNSTFSVWNVEIYSREKSSVFFIYESSVSLSCCSMKYSAKRCIPPFAQTGGCLCCENISLTTSAAENGIPSLIASHPTEAFLTHETSNRVSISNSAFSSVQLLSSPFLSSSGKENVNLARSSFCNMSIASAQTIRIPSSISESLNSISGCSFCEVCDVFYGGVIQSINTEGTTLCSSNNTYQRCIRNANANAYYSGESGHQVLTQSETFEDDTFDGCLSPEVGGAILASKLPITLTVRRSEFISCTAPHIGAVYAEAACGVTVQDSNFSCCYSTSDGVGALQCHNFSEGFILITGCLFDNCNSSDHYAGAIRLVTIFGRDGKKVDPFLVDKCTFFKNKAGSDAGALFVHGEIDTSFLLKESAFQGNTAGLGGGAFQIHQYINMQIGKHFIFMKHCVFDGNTAGNGNGHDVYVIYPNLIDCPFELSYSTTKKQRVWFNSSQTYYDSWLGKGLLKRYVSSTGSDAELLCGKSEDKPCKTIERAVRNSGYATVQGVKLLASMFVPLASIECREKHIEVSGESHFNSIVRTQSLEASSVLFSVSSGSLMITAIQIQHDSTAHPSPRLFVVSSSAGVLSLSDVLILSPAPESRGSEIDSSPFVLNMNCISLRNVEIRNMVLSVPIFSEVELSSTISQRIVNVTFENITRTTGSGSIFSSSLDSGCSFSLSNTTLKSCSCANGDGGGMHISMQTGSELRIGDNSNVMFESCSSPADESKKGKGGAMYLTCLSNECSFRIELCVFDGCDAWKGKNVFVEAQDLSAVINSTSIEFHPQIGINATDFSELSGIERDNPEMIIPLALFLRTFQSPVFVSGKANGNDFRLCGFADYPCNTIEKAAEYRFPNSKRIVRLAGIFGFEEEITLSEQSYEIDSSDKAIGLRVETTGTKTQEALVMNSISSTFTEILFELGGSIGDRSSFVHSSGGTLRFEDCRIKMGGRVDSANYAFVSASGGKVEIVGMNCGGNVGNVRFGGCVIVVNGSCECLIDEVIMNQTNTDGAKGLIEIATSGSAAIQNCSIANCDFSSCGAIQVEKCSSITLKNTSFENITRGAGDGGCVCVDSNEDGSKDTMRIENCTFLECEVSENGKGGGGLSVSLENPSELYVSSTRFEKCCAPSANGSNGKGGGIFLSLTEAGAKFEFIDALVFDGNDAEYGKNIFISTNDLNTTVTNESFNFDYSSMKNDKTLFVGSDNNHQEKDLFMFLIPYSSTEIFISLGGFDVARCGSEEEPCFTMWKGIKNMNDGEGKKTIQIEGSTIVQDSFDMSNYQIKKASSMGEEGTKAILNFEKAIGNLLEYFMENDEHLELTNIQLQLTSGFGNSAKTIISNKRGELVITECSFHSDAEVNNGFDCVFVDVIGGNVEVNDLSMESCNVGNSIFVINNAGVSCNLMNVRVESLNETEGCLLLIKGPESTTTTKINEVDEKMNLNIDNSSFSGVKRSDNGASILELKSGKKICLIVNSSNITEDKAESSEKGGATFFTLGASGSMKIIESTVSHCSCIDGKGGGVYLATKERGFLDFTFVGIIFSANTAKVGNDIFVECFNISSQINESQFQFDLRENHYSRINAIYGIDSCEHKEDINLIGFVTIHQSDTIIVSSVNGLNDKQCGTKTLPCASIDHGLIHLTSDILSLIFVVEKSVIEREFDLKEMSLSSKSRDLCEVEVETEIEKTREALVTTAGTVSLVRVNFAFDSNFISQHESFVSPEGGILEIINCSFDSKQSAGEGNTRLANIRFHTIKMTKGELQLDGCTISNLILQKSSIYLSSSLPSVIYLFEISNSTVSHSLVEINECGRLELININTENITVEGNEKSLISCLSMKKTIQLANCTLGGVSSKTTKWKLMKLEDCLDVKMDSCIFDGSSKERNEKYLNEEEEMCRWSGSVVDVVKSSVMMKVSTITNSPEGGITMRGGNVIIEKGEFIDNNPSIEGYPSLRRNIICSDSGTLNVMSLKGGDGVLPNTSLWMLNEGCSFEGIVSERDSSFFIPALESVEAKEETDRMKLIFKGMLLVPCNLSFSVVKRKGEEKEFEKHEFDSNRFLSEREVEGSVAKDLISSCGDEIEVSVCIIFGNAKSPSSTKSFILKNASKFQSKDEEDINIKDEDERKREINESDRGSSTEKKSGIEWSLFAFVGCIVVLMIFVILFVVVVVFLQKKLKESEKKVEKERMENEEIMGKIERRRRENNGGSFEMSEMPSTLLEGMTSQIPLLIDNDEEDLPEPPSMSNDEILNENDLPDLEPPLQFSENASVSGASQSHSLNVISAKKPFREKEKKNIKTLHSVIHSVQGDFTLGTRAMDVVDGKEVVLAVAALFEHLISVGYERMEMMGKQLCPYAIFVEEGNVNEIYVLTEELEDEKEKEEMKRWKAPEAEDDGIEKAVVFTLGLILHEMTSGEEPLSEFDAEEAQEMMRNGVRPLTEGIEGEELVELMEKMWADEPNERLTLAQVKESLRELMENNV
ncbi:uncharacterized protein MONOS_2783 [Monocercomonoides exilis]|uniref:uncharacterized protein n=1 Tax=Monocercomonoides exilis TaxID=2049356 RepID=UPI0035598D89|nr:hypothetical protein MONOS_2783 [Monocercomonoides exilis]|eukprot:MONOS_2783.1-p1 / transcript=MONOS_2783.1 / gene=MONOS_2783 / organism=Monocercomonoides_exilis_PA203 / gene_product=unspecified product / transcript_product=unspecified product / location=Mono_scaffold00059:118806-126557(+) / protein_length=2537 / sequence_SO=supercontig / SO=protein_coding / is_pseudo=false